MHDDAHASFEIQGGQYFLPPFEHERHAEAEEGREGDTDTVNEPQQAQAGRHGWQYCEDKIHPPIHPPLLCPRDGQHLYFPRRPLLMWMRERPKWIVLVVCTT
jgi:hypothetical protein